MRSVNFSLLGAGKKFQLALYVQQVVGGAVA